MSDEADRQDLEDRVEQLESTISQMLPSRRDALKLGGAALVGGAAMSGSASAGTQQAGTIGTAAEPVDVESEDISNADTVTTEEIVVNDGLVAGEFLGSDSGGSTLQVTGIDFTKYKQLILFVDRISGDGSNNVELTFLNDTSNSYMTVFNDGTVQTEGSSIQLFTFNTPLPVQGTVTLTRNVFTSRPAVENNMFTGFHKKRFDKIGIKGGSIVNFNTGSVELKGAADSTNNFEVYGVR